MGNSYFGTSASRLRQAELGLASYGYFTQNQIEIKNVDINKELAELQKEYNDFYDQQMDVQDDCISMMMNGDWVDVPVSPDLDTRIRHDKRELWEHGHK